MRALVSTITHTLVQQVVPNVFATFSACCQTCKQNCRQHILQGFDNVFQLFWPVSDSLCIAPVVAGCDTVFGDTQSAWTADFVCQQTGSILLLLVCINHRAQLTSCSGAGSACLVLLLISPVKLDSLPSEAVSVCSAFCAMRSNCTLS